MRRPNVVLMAIVGLLGCGPGTVWAPGPEVQLKAPPALLEGVLFEGFRGGVREVQIRARSAEVDLNTQDVVLDRVSILLTGTEGGEDGPVHVKAAKGRMDLKTDAFVLEGEVVATTAKGERAETARLHYEPERHLLVSHDPVRMISERMHIDAAGLELDVRTRRVRLLGPVRARTEPR